MLQGEHQKPEQEEQQSKDPCSARVRISVRIISYFFAVMVLAATVVLYESLQRPPKNDLIHLAYATLNHGLDTYSIDPMGLEQENESKPALMASSVEEDLYISLVDAITGNIIETENPVIIIADSKGKTKEYTLSQGTFYLKPVSAGKYIISLKDKEAYPDIPEIECTVTEKVKREKIENIRELVELREESELRGETGRRRQQGEETPIREIETGGDNPTTSSGIPSSQTPSSQTPSSQTPSSQTPSSQTPSSQTPSSQTPSSQAPSSQTPSSQTPSSRISSGETSSPPEETIVGWYKKDGKTYYYDADGNKLVGLCRIDEKLYFFNADGVMAKSLGIDVSTFNGSVDWSKVKADGIEFVILRVGGRGWGSGAVYIDNRMEEYFAGARAAGIKIGLYFFSEAITVEEAVEEASLALEVLNDRKLELPIYIDLEYSGDYPNGRADLLSAEQRTLIAKAFCETVVNAGYQAGVYASQSFYEDELIYSEISQYHIWLANYTSGSKMPSFTKKYEFWQFSEKGKVSGISGNVDINAVY